LASTHAKVASAPVFDAVQQQIHARHRCGGDILLLAVELAE
jgi:hypothetical protein